ncbi:MAG: DNA repair protein RecN [Bacteroidetes bacterium]|nr:DNA repair protein RecN [Bacteroidota bacterium]
MIQKLFIQNYALIDHLELEFDQGLNMITGETGAGKSILLGALALILGNRADTSSLLDKTKKCIIEGQFKADKKKLKHFFESYELDFENPLVIRREISVEGKSRSFINDTPVTLGQLKELGLLLVDVHSQHETLLLNQSIFQLSVVDAFAKHEDLLSEYRNRFHTLQKLKAELGQLVEVEKKSKADLDYYRFLFDELEGAKLVPGEPEKLEDELQSLTHAEEIKSTLATVLASLSNGDENLLSRVGQLQNSVNAIARFHSGLDEIVSRIKSLHIELKDIGSEMDAISDGVVYDPDLIAAIQERLNTVYQLQQKHRVGRVEELLLLKDEFEGKLAAINSLDERILSLTKEVEDLQKQIIASAQLVSANRNKVIPHIEKEIGKLLKEVSLENAVFKIENNVLPEDKFNANGIDQVRFLFSANKGVACADISKVASGGELSRLMLCIKASVAKLIFLPTIIFDEIDTGISGETAVSVGKVLKELSGRHQLIAITHLPQIAGRGESHYFVYKEITGKKTFTKVRKLNADERIVEIAKMLSGEKPSAIAMENAKELLKN